MTTLSNCIGQAVVLHAQYFGEPLDLINAERSVEAKFLQMRIEGVDSLGALMIECMTFWSKYSRAY